MNVFTQCSSCNSFHSRDQHRFIEWFIREYGQEEYLALLERSRKTVKRNKKDLEKLLEDYKKI